MLSCFRRILALRRLMPGEAGAGGPLAAVHADRADELRGGGGAGRWPLVGLPGRRNPSKTISGIDETSNLMLPMGLRRRLFLGGAL